MKWIPAPLIQRRVDELRRKAEATSCGDCRSNYHSIIDGLQALVNNYALSEEELS